MKARMRAFLARIDPRLVLPAMLFVAGMAAFEGWYLVLRNPLGEYLRLKAATISMAAALESASGQQAELNRLQAELKRLSDRVDGGLLLATSDAETAAFLISELDRIAARHAVLLTGVRPGSRRQVLGLEEISFDVGAQGEYLPLCRWLIELKPALGQRTMVTSFEMKSIGEGRNVALALTLALFRPLQSPGANQ